MRNAKAAWIIAMSALVLAMPMHSAQAMLVEMPTPVPLDEVLAKVDGYIKDHPKDAFGYYLLGRVQALAWGYGRKIPVVWNDRSKIPQFGDYATICIARQGMTEAVIDNHGGLGSRTAHPELGDATAADLAHLQASIDAYSKAITLDPASGLYEEGLAWMMQKKGQAGPAMADGVGDLTDQEKSTFARAISQLGDSDPSVRQAATRLLQDAMPRCAVMLGAVKTDAPEVTARIAGVFKNYWDLQALSHYRTAYALALQNDLQSPTTSPTDGLVSADSAQQIQAILAEHPAAAKSGEIADLQNTLARLADKRKKRMIVP